MQSTKVDYYNLDELFSEEQNLIGESIQEWVNRSVKPIIDKASHDHSFPIHLMKEMGKMVLLGLLFQKNMVDQA